jgi:hypothetical protein
MGGRYLEKLRLKYRRNEIEERKKHWKKITLLAKVQRIFTRSENSK